MRIRQATADDCAQVESIVARAYGRYVAAMGQKPGPMLDDYARRIADGEVFVAEADGVVSGILVLIDADGALLLDNVAVAPEAQGKGVGKALIAFAEAEAARRSYRKIRLYTNVAMTENLTLYPRLGYRETHRVTEKGFDRIYFEKEV